MLQVLAYALLVYVCIGMILYVWGHPGTFMTRKSKPFTVRGTTTRIGQHLANGVQVANFVLHGIPRRSPAQAPAPVKEVYEASIRRAFEKSGYFITTGSPHGRALYLRNYAWFYPTLLSPVSFISRHDADRRVALIRRSLSIIFQCTTNVPYSTTLIPISPRKFAPVNYINEPSDSLLGVLSGLEQLTHAAAQDGGLCHNGVSYSDILERAAREGQALIEKHRFNLRFQLGTLINALRDFGHGNQKAPIIDRDSNRSTATDTRLERRRFVTNANVWATLRQTVELGVVPQDEIEGRIGRTLDRYKEELLELFGERGYMADSLENLRAEDYRNVTLDFCHVYRGFWTFSSPREIELFRNTAEIFLMSTELQDDSRRCFLVAAQNPHMQFFKQVAVASYHGRTMWPAFNVEFADRMFDLSAATGSPRYRDAASEILKQLKICVERIGFYPELLREDGRPYRTWIYRCARADSWFPRFASVWARVMGNSLI